MKVITLLMKVVLFMNYSSATAAEVAAPHDLKSIMQRPLIVGASVSGDYLTASPGKRLALQYTQASQIEVLARKGKPGREVLKLVKEESLKDRTAILGIDLFFWDSFGGSLAESIKALEQISSWATKNQIPLVLGEVPELSPQFQPNAKALNEKIREICKPSNHCKVLPLNSLLRRVLADGYITHKDIRYSLDKLLPDGLHIGAPASEFLADQIALLW